MDFPFILGAAQLGMNYGIANRAGRPDQNVADGIVREAVLAGISIFDTAQAYGDSETVLGHALKKYSDGRQVKVITKLSPELSKNDSDTLRYSIEGSLRRLGVSHLMCLMFHREEHLSFLDGAMGQAVETLLKEKVIHGFGISVYSPRGALDALRHPLVTVVQLPTSLFDRRFDDAGVFSLAHERGKQIHIRSALLQGVLGMEPQQLPACLNPLVLILSRFNKICERHEVPSVRAALAWVLSRHPGAKIVFGAETIEQVRMNVESVDLSGNFESLFKEMDAIIPPQDERLLNPSLWNRGKS